MINEYGAVGWMKIGRGNRSTRRKPNAVPLCPPQILHDLTWDRTRILAASNRLTYCYLPNENLQVLLSVVTKRDEVTRGVLIYNLHAIGLLQIRLECHVVRIPLTTLIYVQDFTIRS
jgi:hypothetical protein